MVRDVFLVSIAVFLSIVFASLLLKDSSKIAVIDTKKLFQELVKTTSHNQGNVEEGLANLEPNIRKFNEELKKRAAEQNIILINKSSIVAGGTDITDEALLLLDDYLQLNNKEQ